ncbi:MAG: hypothetical protein EXS48_02585 [Candidatus Staskawiczbacteria bacterium]|nr:hypothetical protein [Candidatus Staskawiczbacteria bacterium]
MPERFPSSEGEDFLKEKYPDLPKSPEVESAVKRQELREGEEIGNDPKEKIGAYLDRLNEIFNPEDADKKERRVDILKDKLHDKFVIKEVPESYFKQQQKIAREQGHGDIEITNQLRQEALKTITADQKQSLDNWVDYLSSSDATYPDWLKYWAFRSVIGLSQYDKDAHEFKKRSKTTTAPFLEINREALAYVLDAVQKQQKEKKGKKKTENETEPQQPTDEEWEKILKTQNFGKLYAYAVEKITPASEEEKENISGEWVKYEKSDDPEAAKPLYESLQGRGTGWCIAGQSVAEDYLKQGDHYIYYTKDKQGLNKIPRVAIRMANDEISEVRGIVDTAQNLEPIMADIAKEKMSTLRGGEKYEKKVSDMKRLTEIEKKFINIKEIKKEIEALHENHEMEKRSANLGDREAVQEIVEKNNKFRERNLELQEKQTKIWKENRGKELTEDELRFLYELDRKVEGFGYKKDPRIEEIKQQRDLRKDYSKVFDCKPEEIIFEDSFRNPVSPEKERIATSGYDNTRETIGDATVAFIGDLNFNFQRLKEMPANLQYVTGDLSITYSDIKDLGKLKFIGGSVHFDTPTEIDFSKVRIGGDLMGSGQRYGRGADDIRPE